MRTPLEQIWADLFIQRGIAFQEQVSIGPYQADFIIGKFDIEIDGLQHRVIKKHIMHDKKRDEYFEKLGYTVIRIPMNYHNFHRKKQQSRFHEQIKSVFEKISMGL